jgi:hypothetical protein
MSRRVFWAAALTVLVAFIVFDFVSTLSTCQKGDQQQTEQRGEKGCGFAQSLTYAGAEVVFEWVDRRHDFINATATVFIALFTIALWRSTDKLWSAGERQLKFVSDSAADQARDIGSSSTDR